MCTSAILSSESRHVTKIYTSYRLMLKCSENPSIRYSSLQHDLDSQHRASYSGLWTKVFSKQESRCLIRFFCYDEFQKVIPFAFANVW